MQRRVTGAILAAPVTVALLLSTPALALSPEELAKLAQNPIGNLISIPFQNNSNFEVGPKELTQNVLNIQPVIPIELNKDWNVITRTIIPVISQPAFTDDQSRKSGVGDIQFSAFLSPSVPRGLIWGAGLIAQLPTHSNAQLGNDRAGLGPSIVVLHVDPADPWVYGVLANNVWSVGSGDSAEYNNLLVQPFVNYNLPGGFYLASAPVVTANWKAASGEKWTVPVGGGVGKIFHLGKLPVNTQLSAYYNVERPENAARWQLRFQVQFMFPKAAF